MYLTKLSVHQIKVWQFKFLKQKVVKIRLYWEKEMVKIIKNLNFIEKIMVNLLYIIKLVRQNKSITMI